MMAHQKPKKYADDPFRIALHSILEQKRGLQREMATNMDISQQTISSIKTGSHYGKEETRRKIAFYLGYNYEEMRQYGLKLKNAGGVQNNKTEYKTENDMRKKQLISRLAKIKNKLGLRVSADLGIDKPRGMLLTILQDDELLRRLSMEHNIDLNWLYTGEGTIFKNKFTKEEQQAYDALRKKAERFKM